MGKFKIGLNMAEGPMEIIQIRKKRKLVYTSSLQGLLHISQICFQAIFHLDLGFLPIFYTRAKKLMFRHF